MSRTCRRRTIKRIQTLLGLAWQLGNGRLDGFSEVGQQTRHPAGSVFANSRSSEQNPAPAPDGPGQTAIRRHDSSTIRGRLQPAGRLHHDQSRLDDFQSVNRALDANLIIPRLPLLAVLADGHIQLGLGHIDPNIHPEIGSVISHLASRIIRGTRSSLDSGSGPRNCSGSFGFGHGDHASRRSTGTYTHNRTAVPFTILLPSSEYTRREGEREGHEVLKRCSWTNYEFSGSLSFRNFQKNFATFAPPPFAVIIFRLFYEIKYQVRYARD